MTSRARSRQVCKPPSRMPSPRPAVDASLSAARPRRTVDIRALGRLTIRRVSRWPAAVIFIMLAACSNTPSNDRSRDAGVGLTPGIVGQQLYRCNDGSSALVDFLSDGLTIVIRTSIGGKPVSLHAPGQGQRYVGKRVSAEMTGKQLFIQDQGWNAAVCVRSK